MAGTTPDTVADDVRALLEGDFGDDRILRQIYRACENGEVISNYEMRYVRDLAERHLGRADPAPAAPRAAPEPPPVPDVIIPAARPRPRQAKRRRRSPGLIIVVVVALAVAVPAAVLLAAYEAPDPGSPPAGPHVGTDMSSYGSNEIIRIDGVSDGRAQITVSITDGAGDPVWREEVDVKDDGTYSTLTAADAGWGSGAFTVTAGSESATFSLG